MHVLLLWTVLALQDAPAGATPPLLSDDAAAEIENLRVQGDFDEALSRLERLVEEKGGDNRTLALEALVLYDLGRRLDGNRIVVEHFRGNRAWDIAEVYIVLGRVQIEQLQDFKRAAPKFELALLYEPKNAEAKFLKVVSDTLAKNDVEGALRVLEFADRSRLPHGCYDRWCLETARRVAHSAVARGDKDETVGRLVRYVVENAAGEADSHLLLCDYEILRGEESKALEALDHVAEAFPDRMPDVLRRRASLAAAREDWKKVLEDAGGAVTLAPDDVPSLILASRAALELGLLEETKKYLSKLDSKGPAEHQNHFLHARYFLRRALDAEKEGRKGDAVVWLRQAEKRALAAVRILPLDVASLELLARIAKRLGERSQVRLPELEKRIAVARKVAGKHGAASSGSR